MQSGNSTLLRCFQVVARFLKVRDFFSEFEKPFLCVGAGDDPVTNGFEKQFLAQVPGTKDQPHEMIGGGHFFQWTRAEKLSEILSRFIKSNN